MVHTSYPFKKKLYLIEYNWSPSEIQVKVITFLKQSEPNKVKPELLHSKRSPTKIYRGRDMCWCADVENMKS